jgi:gamma-glutamyltranspeptidase/glutathione hydrolase
MQTRPSALLSLVFLLAGLCITGLSDSARGAARAPAIGTHGMVVSPQADASAAGVAMLAAGGNAVDAAVATAFALGVSDAHHSGIGGGGFILIRLADGTAVAIDARETAPAAASADMYLQPGLSEHPSRVGVLAVATPGLLKGLAWALEDFGTKSLAEVLEPAIRIAEQGFEIGPRHARAADLWRQLGGAKLFPETAAIQLPPGGAPIEPGWRLVQADLGRTLRLIAAEGPDVFYRGSLARAIADAVQNQGGILTAEDLQSYQAKRREPIRGSYRDYEILSFPPPSSGGIALVEIANILEPFDLSARGAGSSASLHVMAEAMKLAFADRAAYLGDEDFVDVPTAELISKQYADRQRSRINPAWWRRAPWRWGKSEAAIRVEGPGEPAGGGGTTHLSVTDAAGNAVAITQTINLLFGSGVTVPGTGIVLNNEMDDFSIRPNQPNAFGLVDTRGSNAIAPGKRPLSSMTPTIVAKDGKPFMVTGSPGGPRIITTTLLSILNVVDYGMDVQEAVSAPRFHHQWVPDRLVVEAAVPVDVIEALRSRGHQVEVSKRNWSSAQAIVVDPGSGRHLGGSDPRSDGVALGYSPSNP